MVCIDHEDVLWLKVVLTFVVLIVMVGLHDNVSNGAIHPSSAPRRGPPYARGLPPSGLCPSSVLLPTWSAIIAIMIEVQSRDLSPKFPVVQRGDQLSRVCAYWPINPRGIGRDTSKCVSREGEKEYWNQWLLAWCVLQAVCRTKAACVIVCDWE